MRYYSTPVGERSTAISVSVCLSVCLSVCPRAYLWNRWIDLREMCCADPLWPWLGPPLAALRYRGGVWCQSCRCAVILLSVEHNRAEKAENFSVGSVGSDRIGSRRCALSLRMCIGSISILKLYAALARIPFCDNNLLPSDVAYNSCL